MSGRAAIACVLAFMALSVVGARCLADDSEQALRQRSQERYPQLRAAKDQGKIGETYEGMIEAVDAKYLDDAALKKLVDDENADRVQLYQLIAQQTQTTSEQVAGRAAERNFKNAHKGDYLKYKENGWQRKD